MSKSDYDPSIDNEPQWRNEPAQTDPSEAAADRAQRHAGPRDTADDLASHSVFDEPDILPCRPPETIDRDWSCAECGYNLRGLVTGRRCPECGHVNIYRPPPPGVPSFSDLYRRKQEAVSSRRSWAYVLTVAVIGAFVATPAAMIAAVWIGLPFVGTVIVFVPVVQEAAKILPILLFVEIKPFLIKRGNQIWFAAMFTALLYAAGFNTMTTGFQMITKTPPLELLLWRWIGGTLLHVACTAVACSGVVAAWRRADDEARRPRLGNVTRSVLLAMMFHAAFNAMVFFWNAKDYAF